MLTQVYKALTEIGSDNSRLFKEAKLKEYAASLGEPFLWTLWYALNPYLSFHIRELEYNPIHELGLTYQDLFGYLQFLSEQRGASDSDREELSRLASSSPETFEVVRRIINKDLKCGVSIKTAKIVYPAIPEYEIMKAEHGNWDRFLKLAGGWENVCYSVKLDGVRVSFATVYEDGSTVYYSSAGKPYENFKVFDQYLIDLAVRIQHEHKLPWPIRFDGEVVTWDTDFQKVMTQVRRMNNVDPSLIRLVLWDVVCDKPYNQRYQMLSDLMPTSGLREDLLRIRKLTRTNVLRLDTVFEHNITSVAQAEVIARLHIDSGCEGTMFKTSNGPYEMTRSWHWFKVKSMYLDGQGIEADLPVIGFEYGNKRTKYEKKVGKLIVLFGKKKVGVGSGMSDEQRLEFVTNIPKMIQVRADGVTKSGSLRLPIFVRVRDDKSVDDISVENL